MRLSHKNARFLVGSDPPLRSSQHIPSLLYHLPFLHVDPCGLDLFLPSCPNTHPLHYFTFQCFAPLPIPCPTPTHIPCCLLLSRALPSWEPNTHTSLASQHTHPLLPNTHIPCPSAFSHTHPLPTFSSYALFLLLLSNTHIPSLLHLAVLCLVSHTHSLPYPLTRSSSVGATRTSLGLHTSQPRHCNPPR